MTVTTTCKKELLKEQTLPKTTISTILLTAVLYPVFPPISITMLKNALPYLWIRKYRIKQ